MGINFINIGNNELGTIKKRIYKSNTQHLDKEHKQ